MKSITRRDLIFRAGAGFGGLALSSLLDSDGLLAQTPHRNPLTAHESHFPAKAKSVIFLFMYGGVSQVDTLDPKPELARHHGKPMTGKGAIDVFFGNPGNLMASPILSSRNTANRASKSRSSIRIWRSASTISA